MVIIAHPDDAEFTCGGTLALWASQGAEIGYVVCTDGSKGRGDPSLSPEELAAVRRAEQRAAADLLGVKEVVFLGHPDGELSRVVGLEAELALGLRCFRPQVVMTFDPWRPYQLHPDHRAVGLAALNAVLAAGNPRFFSRQPAGEVQAHRVETVYLFATDRPDAWVDITETFEPKMAAIDCHRSQVAERPDIAEQIRRCNRDYGRQAGTTYAEAFKVLHPFCEA
jgi:LmbE family N-acetylglucosaminyl deacetylase